MATNYFKLPTFRLIKALQLTFQRQALHNSVCGLTCHFITLLSVAAPVCGISFLVDILLAIAGLTYRRGFAPFPSLICLAIITPCRSFLIIYHLVRCLSTIITLRQGLFCIVLTFSVVSKNLHPLAQITNIKKVFEYFTKYIRHEPRTFVFFAVHQSNLLARLPRRLTRLYYKLYLN